MAEIELLTIGGIQPGYNGCTQESLSAGVTTKNQISGNGYDAAGNMISAPGMGSYTWDAENRMTSTAGVTYTYDGDGKRVQRSNGKLYWYGMSSDPLLETDLAGNVPTEFVFFNGKRIARRDSAGAIHYFFSDHLGSARIVTNATGGIVEESDFYPFGGERVVVDSLNNQYKFTGKERDVESGLDNLGARYFASTVGRFISPDLLLLDQYRAAPQSWNLYGYARNNPLLYIDPTGNAVELLGDEEWRKKALALLQKSLGNKEAALRLYINEVKDGDKTRYFVGIKGDVGEFMKLSETSHDLANLVEHKNVVEFGLTSQDLSRWAGAVTYEPGEAGNHNVRVLVNPDQASVANYTLNTRALLGATRFQGQFQDPPWTARPFVPATMAWHEFGHAWGLVNGRPSERTNPEAFAWENRMRKQLYGPLGPNNAPRIAH